MKVFIFGTGNVASALGYALLNAGHNISGVYGRSITKSQKLAKKLNCKFYNSLSKIPVTYDIYLLAISDDAIAEFAKKLPALKGILAHTSGSTDLSSLGKIKNKGVFYPVETIKIGHPKSFRKVPICIEASNEQSLRKLIILAKSISEETYILDSNKRATLHLAAVFTNNFTNHLIGIAHNILDESQLPKEILKQLAFSTIKNAFNSDTTISQTGPAVRNDEKTIKKHLEKLKTNKGAKEIYTLLTNEIKNVHNKKTKK